MAPGCKGLQLSICVAGDGDVGARNVKFFRQIDSCDILLRIVEVKSTTRASESLDLPKSGISRQPILSGFGIMPADLI
jgi:hypothetical protein